MPDYVVYTGVYTLTLGTAANAAPMASFQIDVVGDYTFNWDFKA